MKMLFVIVAAATMLGLTPAQPSLSPEEEDLYNRLNAYRKQQGLSAIPLSPALTKVARLHVYDLKHNQPVKGHCNLHSWSNKGKWKPCCYTGDNASAECMWSKPEEIAGYKGYGFEIAAYATEMDAETALNGWKSSRGHNQVIINAGDWSHTNWKAVGIGINEQYAVVWFGTLPDESTF